MYNATIMITNQLLTQMETLAMLYQAVLIALTIITAVREITVKYRYCNVNDYEVIRTRTIVIIISVTNATVNGNKNA